MAARPIPKGYVIAVGGREVEVREPIALGHKVALAPIAVGEPVRKYGQIIGFASGANRRRGLDPRAQRRGRALRP